MNLATLAQKCFGEYVNHPQGELNLKLINEIDTSKIELNLIIKNGDGGYIQTALGNKPYPNNLSFKVQYDLSKNQLLSYIVQNTEVKSGNIIITDKASSAESKSLEDCQKLFERVVPTLFKDSIPSNISNNFINRLDVLTDLSRLVEFRDRQIAVSMLPTKSNYARGKDAIRINVNSGVCANSFKITVNKIKGVKARGVVETGSKLDYVFNLIKSGNTLVFYSRDGVGLTNVPKGTHMPITSLRDVTGLIANIVSA